MPCPLTQHVSYFARRIDVTNPYALADFAASLTTADAKELQDVLETVELEPRLQKALLLLKKEHALNQLQASIKQDVEKRIDKQQRTYFLMEQLKSIKKELGLEKDDKVSHDRSRPLRRLRLAAGVDVGLIRSQDHQVTHTRRRTHTQTHTHTHTRTHPTRPHTPRRRMRS